MFTQEQIAQLQKLFETNNAKLMNDVMGGVRTIVREEVEVESEKIRKEGNKERVMFNLRLSRIEDELKDVKIEMSNLKRGLLSLKKELQGTEVRLTTTLLREVKDISTLIVEGFAVHNDHDTKH